MEKSVIAYLEKTALEFPDKIACACGGTSLTYRELQAKVKRIAISVSAVCAPCKHAVVFMEKSCEALTALWGIIYAGCCYTVLDPTLPAERISSMIGTLQPQCIITSTGRSEKIQSFSGEILDIVKISAETKFSAEEELKLAAISESSCDIDPLYTIFTSGSTGVPKGVVVNHRSVIDFIEQFTQIFGISADDIIGNQAPWDFDVSVKDIFSAAKTGASLEIIPRKKFFFPKELLDLLDEKRVTTLIWAVSALCILSSDGALAYKTPRFIEKFIFSGEVMPINHFSVLSKAYPNALFANVYGPTEITCNCLYYIVEKNFSGDAIPLGRPFPNERVFLLDEKDRKIDENSPGRTGEICVSGSAVAMGYYGNETATRQRFVQNPLNCNYREIIYRTGDLAYYDKDGLLLFSGRKDFQIKHMGHRIELEEIERSINAVDNVRRACCVYENGKIMCFYEGESGTKEIITYLSRKLPRYMIPSVFSRVNAMPLTKNGKINRKLLLADYNENRE